MSPAKTKFREAVLLAVKNSVYPSPRVVLSLLAGEPVEQHSFNGRQLKWRAEILTELGWTRHPNAIKENWTAVAIGRMKSRPKYPRYSWVPPGESK